MMPRVGVLVLRNGEVLHGQVTAAGDRYSVAWGEGGEVRIPTDDVEMFCGDLHEAYLRKHALAERGGLNRTLELAEWCLRQSMYAEAADEVLAAATIDSKDPRIRRLERRLQLATSQPPPPLNPPPKPAETASLPDVERTFRELPKPVVEKFTTSLQPLLLNRCGVATCHGAASESEFRLLKPGYGQTTPRRYTQRNLYAVLQQINNQCPDRSPLLTVPSGPHGTLSRPAFSEREQGLVKSLRDWVKLAAKQELTAPPKTIAASQDQVLQASFAQHLAPPQTKAAKGSGAASSSAPAAQTRSSGTNAVPASQSNDTSAPGDPFDPEVFNRRFFSSAPPPN